MGGPEGRAILDGFSPNGLLPDETTSVAHELDQDRLSRAEERTADLIAHIQPNQPSEEHRNAIASYVQRLITTCSSCKVFTFGSVPLKTYLPDGDIDLTAFSNNQNFKDSWVHDVRDILESEDRSEDAEFRVKEVQYIQAEVKIIKCLVENIVVDISFNQLGGLCTLCFLEEVDNLIGQNHLFKRSIILIKAWCYYESRILGAHHGLISTYALETLVLYIFHVYNNAFSGPLEVLYRFLEFFSKFDWDNYCVSLWGPVPKSSLPDTQAEPPRRDCGELLLNKYFLDACSSVYTVVPSSQESRDQPFVSKYFNIIDPLRANNNLGRSVSKGNFFRIRSAFTFGAQRLVRLLDCPEEDLIAEFDLFFRNTWDRHGKGHRPDVPSIDIYVRNKEVVENTISHESEVEGARASHASHGVYWQQVNHSKVPKQMLGTFDASAVSNTWSHKINGILSNSMTSDLKHANSMKNALADRGRSPKYTSNEVHAMHHFARTHSSPEFTHISGEVPSQPRPIGTSETERGKGHSPSSIIDNSKRSSSSSGVSDKHSERVSAKNQHSSWQASSYWRTGDAIDSKDATNKQDGHSVEKLMQMHQEEQDIVNMTAAYRDPSFNGYPQAPNSANSTSTPFPVLLPFLASGYTHANSVGMVPTNVPFEYFWGHNMPYSQGLGSFPGSQCFPNVKMTSNLEEINETVDENLVVPELNHKDGIGDRGFWSEQDVNSVGVHACEDGTIQAQQQRDRKTFASVSPNSVNSSCQTSSGSYSSKDCREPFENGQLIRQNYGDDLPDERNIESDVNSTSKSFIPASHATSTTKLSSSNFSNGSTLEDSKLTREQSGLKAAYPAESALHVKKYEGPLDSIVLQRDDDGKDWIRQPTVGTDFAEGTSAEAASSDVQTYESTSYGQGPMSVSNSTVPLNPVLVGHGSGQRSIDEQGLLPVIFYATGPPVPFLTMLPLYNLPAAEGTSYTATNPMDNDAELGNHNGQSNISFDPNENLELSGTLNKPSNMRHGATLESFDKQQFDILNGDFASHWQNLQYGRFCQNTESQGFLPYPPSVASPMFVQGQFPWDSPGRPPVNMNIMTQAPHFVPMMPIPRGSDGHVAISQHSTDELPRFCGGTGPYLPNPKFIRNRHSNTRNHRGSYFYDRKDHHGEREGDWNYNSKPRFASRNNFRYHVERSGTRMDKTNLSNRRPGKPLSPYKHGSFNSSMLNNHITSDVPYGMHPLPVVGTSGISPSESAVPSIVMLYPHDQNVNHGSGNWPEFGSLGPVHFSRAKKASHRGESSHYPVDERVNFEEDLTESSPDEP